MIEERGARTMMATDEADGVPNSALGIDEAGSC
jgi:hypothetical protein